jgi:hypothetical protein
VTPPSLLHGRAPSQVGILVRSVADALPRYDALLGGGPWRGYHYHPGTVPELRYRGGPGAYWVTLAFNATTPQVELLEGVEGPSIFHEWLERRGYGLHHLGFWVESLAASISAMNAEGYEVIQAGAGYGLDGDGGFAFFDTERDLGVVLEAIEVPRRRREPDFTWPP